MLDHANHDLRTLCPLCYKPETIKHQDLVCEDCVHNGIELIRNSVIQNEEIAKNLRLEINLIFEVRENSNGPKVLTAGQLTALNSSKSARQPCLQTSDSVVKHLSLQLKRLEILNANIKLQGIEKSRLALQARLATSKAKYEDFKSKIDNKEAQIVRKRQKLNEDYEAALNTKRSEVTRLRGENSLQITHQAKLLQYSHYKVIRNVAFEGYSTLKLVSRRTKDVMMFYGQPIISLSALLSNNNKVDAINTFIENLISFLILLRDLLFHEDQELLPYLSYLESLLPDTKFYNSVQEKIDAIYKEASDVEVVEKAATEDAADVEFLPNSEQSVSFNKVIIHNKTIKIPMSSRTANLNRRASIREHDLELKENLSTENTRTSTPQTPSTSRLPQSLEGKKIVVVPHKILTRPFTRLKPKEYLKFLLIVVKILLSFNTMLKEIEDRMPVKKLKHAKSMMDTLNNLRFKQRFSKTDSGDFLYDIEKILLRFANLDDHFKAEGTEMISTQQVSQKTSATQSFADMSLVLTTTTDSSISASLVNVHNSMISGQAGPSNIRRFYDALVSKTKVRNNVKSKSSTNLKTMNDDLDIYGLISETQSTDTSNLSLQLVARNRGDVAPKKETYDVKSIMEVAHSIIAAGNIDSITSDPAKQNIRKVTLSMMEHSKAQLEEWDVISQMY